MRGRDQTGRGAESANKIYGSTPTPGGGDAEETDVTVAEGDDVRLLHGAGDDGGGGGGGGGLHSSDVTFDGVDGGGGGNVGVSAGCMKQRAGNLWGHPRGEARERAPGRESSAATLDVLWTTHLKKKENYFFLLWKVLRTRKKSAHPLLLLLVGAAARGLPDGSAQLKPFHS